jgi:predicted Zn-dependent protease
MAHRATVSVLLVFAATFVYAQSQTRVPSSAPIGPTARFGDPMDTGLRTAGTINGSVLAVDGRPVADAHIELHNALTGTVIGSVYSNQSGHFEVDNIPSGEYELVVHNGLAEAHESVSMHGMQKFVTVRLADEPATPDAGNSATVSVAQMSVPDKARKAYSKAYEAFSKNKFDEASDQVGKALKMYPDYAEALTLRGLLDLQQGKNETARVELEHAVDCDRTDGMAHIALGSAYNSLKRFDDAVRVLTRGVSLAPNAWQGYFERARALVAMGKYQDSLRDLAKAQELSDRDFPVLHLVKANALIGIQDYTDAQTEIQAYLDRDPQGSNAADARRVLDEIKALTATAKK